MLRARVAGGGLCATLTFPQLVGCRLRLDLIS